MTMESHTHTHTAYSRRINICFLAEYSLYLSHFLPSILHSPFNHHIFTPMQTNSVNVILSYLFSSTQLTPVHRHKQHSNSEQNWNRKVNSSSRIASLLELIKLICVDSWCKFTVYDQSISCASKFQITWVAERKAACKFLLLDVFKWEDDLGHVDDIMEGTHHERFQREKKVMVCSKGFLFCLFLSIYPCPST